MRRIEFWPDYGQALLFSDGAPVDIDGLGLPAGVLAVVGAWLGAYDDAKLESGALDDAWIGEGKRIFALLRSLLAADGIELTDWEGYWSSGANAPTTE
jgi:hypothetical protein